MRDASLNQLERGRPIEPHPALRGVHRFGHLESEPPQMFAKLQRRIPVQNRCGIPRIARAQRVGHDVSRGIDRSVERLRLDMRKRRGWIAQRVGTQRGVGLGEGNLHEKLLSTKLLVRRFLRSAAAHESLLRETLSHTLFLTSRESRLFPKYDRRLSRPP